MRGCDASSWKVELTSGQVLCMNRQQVQATIQPLPSEVIGATLDISAGAVSSQQAGEDESRQKQRANKKKREQQLKRQQESERKDKHKASQRSDAKEGQPKRLEQARMMSVWATAHAQARQEAAAHDDPKQTCTKCGKEWACKEVPPRQHELCKGCSDEVKGVARDPIRSARGDQLFGQSITVGAQLFGQSIAIGVQLFSLHQLGHWLEPNRVP